MSGKRRASELDPDYEDVTDRQTKRQRLFEEDAKEATKRKIEAIMRKEFMTEIQNKEMEISLIDQRLSEARLVMDRLRACIVANYYSSAGQTRSSQRKPTMETQSIHPAVKKNIIGKAPVGLSKGMNSVTVEENPSENENRIKQSDISPRTIVKQEIVEKPQNQAVPDIPGPAGDADEGGRGSRFKLKKRIIVGNLSKYIPVDKREDNDPSTHKWMVYVRGPVEDPKIDHFVKKIWFFLHPSYRPNDLVEISTPPFHLTRRGWGEFPVRIQLHFTDNRNKKVDLIHHLKLDRTYTGLQTLGSETHVNVEIERDIKPDERTGETSKPSGDKQGTVLLSFKDCLKKSFLEIKPAEGSNISESREERTGSGLTNGKISPRSKKISVVSDSAEKSPEFCKTKSKLFKENHSFSPGSLAGGTNLCNTGESAAVSPVAPTVAIPSVPLSSGTEPPLSSPCRDWLQNSEVPVPERITTTTTESSLTPLSSVVATSPSAVTVTTSAVGIATTTATSPSATITVSASPTSLPSPQLSPNNTGAGMVYVRCVDNQGKIYLIPQQLLPQLTGLQSQQSPNKKNNIVGKSIQAGAVSPIKATSVVTGASNSPVCGSKTNTPNSNVLTLPNSTSLLRSPKTNSMKQMATVSVTKAAGESGLLTLSTVTSPVKSPPQPQSVTNKDIKVSTIASCPKAKQPLIFLTQNSQKTVSLLQGNSTPVGKTTALIGGIGGMSIVQQKLGSEEIAKPSVLTGMSVNSAGSVIKPQSSTHNFSLSKTSSGVTNLIIGGRQQPQNQLIAGGASKASNAAVTVPKVQSPATQLIITGSSPKMPVQTVGTTAANSVNFQSLLVKNSDSSSTSQLSSTSCQINCGQLLKTGATILLNKGLPVTKAARPALASSNAVLNTGKSQQAVPQMSATTTTASPPKTHQTMVATIGNQHYLLQLIPDQQNNKPQAAVLANAIGGNSQVTKPVLGQTSVSLSSHLKNHAVGNLQFSTSPLQANMVSSVTTNTGASSGTLNTVLMSPNYSAKMGNFKPVQLTSRYSRKRDKGDGDVSLLSQHRHCEVKNRIILGRKSKTEVKNDQIVDIRLDNISDMYSLVKAVVKHYPLVSSTTDRGDHPYCARAVEDWLHWNVGKRRASEWQRASCVRQHILKLIGMSSTFKGEQLWSIKQIVSWCRLHAFSPHYLEKDPIPVVSESPDCDMKQYTTYTTPAEIHSKLDDLHTSRSSESDEEEIDIITIDLSSTRTKPKVKHEDGRDLHELPSKKTALFVQEISKKVGVKYQPVEIEPGVSGSLTEDILYTVMGCFMEDIIRHSFSSANTDTRYPREIGVSHVFKALCSLQTTDFLTNQHLGVPEPGLTKGNSDR